MLKTNKKFYNRVEKCAIQEAELRNCSKKENEVLEQFVRAQEKNLKKLTGSECGFTFLDDLKDLRLEYFDFVGPSGHGEGTPSLRFLGQQTELRYLRLGNFTPLKCHVDLICGLKKLETLKLDRWLSARLINLSHLQKLEDLKRLEIGEAIGENILDHQKFGVFNHLEELDASFKRASVESVREMKRITPNLRKIRIWSTPSETINALLEGLKKLESVEILGWNTCWDIPSSNVHPKIKYLEVTSGFKIPADQLSKMLPNLEYLWIGNNRIEATVSFFVTLLSRLKRLKSLYMEMKVASDLDPESVLQCFQEFGKSLEVAKIVFITKSETVPGITIEKKLEGSFFLDKKVQKY